MNDRKHLAGKGNFSVLDKIIGTLFQQQKSQSHHEVLVDATLNCRKIAARALVLVLNECLDKVNILGIITQEKIDPAWTDPIVYRSLEDRLNAKEESFDLFTYTNKKKLAKDLCLISTWIDQVIDDILYNYTVDTLQRSIGTYKHLIRDDKDLVDECARNKNLLKKLTLDMRRSCSRNREILNKKADEAYQMQEKFEQELGYGTIEYKYIDKWETNRTYLNQFINDDSERNYQNTINTFLSKQELENRINKEISNFMEVSCADMQDQIESWTGQYESDVDRQEKEMYELRLAKEKLELDFQELTKTYAFRQQEIANWLELREKLRQEEEQIQIQVQAATTIQSWWRGVMVRKHLGPYSKKKGKKGKDKGKKKGKGKKK